MSNPFVWFDHRSETPTEAAGFYRQLFGWEPAPQSPPGMSALGSGQPWAGMAASEDLPAGWLPYVQVESLESSVQQATKLGGRIVKDTTQGPGGTFAVVEDPAGGTVALWQAA